MVRVWYTLFYYTKHATHDNETHHQHGCCDCVHITNLSRDSLLETGQQQLGFHSV